MHILRFIVHPYLKKLAIYLKSKYKVSDNYELILLSSKKAVKVVSSRFYINNPIDIDEDFGVIMVLKGRQYQKVLKFIQHVGYNLSSRLAEDYLYNLRNNLKYSQRRARRENKSKRYSNFNSIKRL